jgi:hypothetical protein
MSSPAKSASDNKRGIPWDALLFAQKQKASLDDRPFAFESFGAPGGESSNPPDAILQKLADWDAELTRLNSPALRKIGEAMFQQCWAASDSGRAYKAALAERGYTLALGDRRAVVAIDFQGQVYAVSKWSGVRTKEVRAKLDQLKERADLAAARERRWAKECAERAARLNRGMRGLWDRLTGRRAN